MKKILLLLTLFFMTAFEVNAYAIKVYDDLGNRVGTYRKEGDKFVLYDFNDKKIENPEEFIKNPPKQEYLKQYTQYVYDSNMMPIGTFTSGWYDSSGRYYPRESYPAGSYYFPRTPYIIRQKVNTKF